MDCFVLRRFFYGRKDLQDDGINRRCKPCRRHLRTDRRHCSRNSSHCEWRALIEEPREDDILIFLFICRHHSRMMRSQTCSISFSSWLTTRSPIFRSFTSASRKFQIWLWVMGSNMVLISSAIRNRVLSPEPSLCRIAAVLLRIVRPDTGYTSPAQSRAPLSHVR